MSDAPSVLTHPLLTWEAARRVLRQTYVLPVDALQQLIANNTDPRFLLAEYLRTLHDTFKYYQLSPNSRRKLPDWQGRDLVIATRSGELRLVLRAVPLKFQLHWLRPPTASIASGVALHWLTRCYLAGTQELTEGQLLRPIAHLMMGGLTQAEIQVCSGLPQEVVGAQWSKVLEIARANQRQVQERSREVEICLAAHKQVSS